MTGVAKTLYWTILHGHLLLDGRCTYASMENAWECGCWCDSLVRVVEREGVCGYSCGGGYGLIMLIALVGNLLHVF